MEPQDHESGRGIGRRQDNKDGTERKGFIIPGKEHPWVCGMFISKRGSDGGSKADLEKADDRSGDPVSGSGSCMAVLFFVRTAGFRIKGWQISAASGRGFGNRSGSHWWGRGQDMAEKHFPYCQTDEIYWERKSGAGSKAGGPGCPETSGRQWFIRTCNKTAAVCHRAARHSCCTGMVLG